MASPETQSGASMADRLANARMMQKSGYTWDPAGTCAKIRLGDGAILQNLYPSHSHVKLQCGKVERIDTYYQRMVESEELLKKITMIKEYEYNQWARTRPLNEKDYATSKPIPIEKIESKSVHPTWDTLRPTNSSMPLGAKNPLFSYEDLVAKFSQPKFLKRLGFIDNEADFNPNKVSMGDEASSTETLSAGSPEIPTVIINTGEADGDKVEPECAAEMAEMQFETESGELSSDDEEYHNEIDPLVNLPPERVPSSKRSNRQRLALYKDECMIGSKSTQDKDLKQPEVGTNPPSRSPSLSGEGDKTVVPLSTVKLVDDIINQKKGTKLSAVEASNKFKAFHSKAFRKGSYKLDFPLKLHGADRKFVRFSQPVCLCPKLSKETLNSFYSPTVQKYLSGRASGFMSCQLHNNRAKNSRLNEKIILKSL